MRTKLTLALGCCLACNAALGLIIDDERIVLRGDANNNGAVNMSDASYINNYLFSGGPAPPCMNQADVNNSGGVDVSDSVYLLNWLFNGGPEPPSPGPYNTVCTADDSPYPGCAVDPCD